MIKVERVLYMKIVKLSRDLFVTEDGTEYPIDPPLEQDMTIEEFEILYGKAVDIIKSLGDVGSASLYSEGVE
jgi:hypothetical protein